MMHRKSKSRGNLYEIIKENREQSGKADGNRAQRTERKSEEIREDSRLILKNDDLMRRPHSASSILIESTMVLNKLMKPPVKRACEAEYAGCWGTMNSYARPWEKTIDNFFGLNDLQWDKFEYEEPQPEPPPVKGTYRRYDEMKLEELETRNADVYGRIIAADNFYDRYHSLSRGRERGGEIAGELMIDSNVDLEATLSTLSPREMFIRGSQERGLLPFMVKDLFRDVEGSPITGKSRYEIS
jgi:hypothetical protein